MVPAGDATESTLEEFAGLLAPGDTIVDGGNSDFQDSKRRHALLAERGIRFVDAGISGGVWGLKNGYGTMVGGDPDRDVRFISLERGLYGVSVLPANFARNPSSLVALELHGQTLTVDHGYPCRLITANRPGVLQTKWLSRIEVT